MPLNTSRHKRQCFSPPLVFTINRAKTLHFGLHNCSLFNQFLLQIGNLCFGLIALSSGLGDLDRELVLNVSHLSAMLSQ